jgi:protein-arginine deiminase
VIDAVHNQSAAASEGGYGEDSINIGGNIECVPPFVHRDTNRVYAHGRVYYGGPAPDPQYPSSHPPMYGALRRFFDKQGVQDPFTIDSGWLRVGHVDEVVSILPMKDARLGFRVLIASPDLATRLLAGIPDATPVFGRYATLRDGQVDFILGAYRYAQRQKTGKSFSLDELNDLESSFRVTTGFLHGTTPQNVGRYSFPNVTPVVEKKLATIRDTFKREVGLEDADFIPLPVLFSAVVPSPRAAEKSPPKPGMLAAVAFTPGVVNGLVITRGAPEWSADRTVTFVMPKPFGPVRHANGQPPSAGNDCVFEEHIRAALGPTSKTGVDVLFADDFEGYHVLDGEVHCGTNSLRTPPRDRRFWAPREDTRR